MFIYYKSLGEKIKPPPQLFS